MVPLRQQMRGTWLCHRLAVVVPIAHQRERRRLLFPVHVNLAHVFLFSSYVMRIRFVVIS